ncbi:MAG: hypothetical protein WAT09_12295 [Paracoccaceae bacterium]
MPVVPELALPDPDQAAVMLADVFGFVAEGGLMRLGNQRVALVRGAAAGHGVIDHLALAVPDVDVAAAAMLARGAVVDPDASPDGATEIAEFWQGGVRYLFLQGPAGARIELIANLAAPFGPDHDHIGLPCVDIAVTAEFLTGLGAVPKASHRLRHPDGVIEVRFLALQDTILELYQPLQAHPVASPGKWRRLLVTGAAPAVGPEGLTIAPL